MKNRVDNKFSYVVDKLIVNWEHVFYIEHYVLRCYEDRLRGIYNKITGSWYIMRELQMSKIR